MFDIIELQHELTQNRLEAEATNSSNTKEEENNYSQVRARIASRNKDINILWKEGSSSDQIAQILMVHPDIVKAQVAKLEKDEEDKREFLQLGIMSESLRTGGCLVIFR
jgi:DNA-binding CsgD family transcriptional regulator